MNFALIEDDEKLLKDLSHILDSIFMKHDLDADVVFSTTDVKSLLNYVHNNKVDVLILDIDLKSDL